MAGSKANRSSRTDASWPLGADFRSSSCRQLTGALGYVPLMMMLLALLLQKLSLVFVFKGDFFILRQSCVEIQLIS